MGPRGRFYPYLIYIAYIGLFGTYICRFIQVLYLGRAPRTKETLPDFREKCRVTRHSRVFRGLKGSQRTPGFWGVTNSARIQCVELACMSQHLQLLTASYFLNRRIVRPHLVSLGFETPA